jgi:hypothetical protein
MRNYSFYGEDCYIKSDSAYLVVIDILYLNELKNEVFNFETLDFEEFRKYLISVEQANFPQSGGGLIAFFEIPNFEKEVFYKLQIAEIKKVNYLDFEDEIKQKTKSIFSTDTGFIILFEWKIWNEMVAFFEYDTLVEATGQEFVNKVYMDELGKKFGYKNFALISTPGLDKGFDFVGSGTYFLPDHFITNNLI